MRMYVCMYVCMYGFAREQVNEQDESNGMGSHWMLERKRKIYAKIRISKANMLEWMFMQMIIAWVRVFVFGSERVYVCALRVRLRVSESRFYALRNFVSMIFRCEKFEHRLPFHIDLSYERVGLCVCVCSFVRVCVCVVKLFYCHFLIPAENDREWNWCRVLYHRHENVFNTKIPESTFVTRKYSKNVPLGAWYSSVGIVCGFCFHVETIMILPALDSYQSSFY